MMTLLEIEGETLGAQAPAVNEQLLEINQATPYCKQLPGVMIIRQWPHGGHFVFILVWAVGS